MPEFEAILKFLVMFGGTTAIIIGAGFGFKRLVKKSVPDVDALNKLHDVETRLAELEERVDFAERALADARARAQIPPRA